MLASPAPVPVIARPTRCWCEVHAAGLDRGTWHLMTGKPYAVRLAWAAPASGSRSPASTSRDRGEVGAAVTRLRAGDEVFGIGDGSFAEFAAADAAKLSPQARDLTFEQAAVVPVSDSPRSRRSPTSAGARPASGCWSPAPPAASAPTPCSSPAPLGAEVTGVAQRRQGRPAALTRRPQVLDYAPTTSRTAPALRPHRRHRRQPAAVAGCAGR